MSDYSDEEYSYETEVEEESAEDEGSSESGGSSESSAPKKKKSKKASKKASKKGSKKASKKGGKKGKGSKLKELFITVGPVIGKVTSTTARILVETAKAGTLLCRAESGDFVTEAEVVLEANRPGVVELEGLKPKSQYLVSFVNAKNKDDRRGSFATFRKKPQKVNFVTISCNKSRALDPDALTLWDKLFDESVKFGNVDVVLHLGDQVYQDENFERMRDRMGSKAKDWEKKREEAAEMFRDEYRLQWNRHGTRDVLAHVSNLMIWDDHEIRDDFGARPEDYDPSSIDYFLGCIAREVYWEYQRALHDPSITTAEGREAAAEANCELHTHVFGTTAIVMLDQRGYRSFGRALENGDGGGGKKKGKKGKKKGKRGGGSDTPYLGARQWAELEAFLDSDEMSDVLNLIVATSVPLVFLNDRLANKAAEKAALDDLRDHWAHGSHIEEQTRMINMLRQWRKEELRDVLVIAGDVHVGGYTAVVDEKDESKVLFKQMISSSITNEVNPAAVFNLLKASLDYQKCDGYCVHHMDFVRNNNYGVVTVDGEMTAELVVAELPEEGCCCF